MRFCLAWVGLSTLVTVPVLSAGNGSNVHLSLGSEQGSVTITWSTESPAASLVRYGEYPALSLTATGTSNHFIDPDKHDLVHRYIHRVTLHGLKPQQRYAYAAGDTTGDFTSIDPSKESLDFMALADLSASEVDQGLGAVLKAVTQETRNSHYDVVFHAGDLAYDLHTQHGALGDAFMKEIEPVASRVPYMVCPGNHESRYNFTHYRQRFTMPQHNATEGLWWSLDIGPVHFVSYNTEAYFDGPMNVTLQEQYKWLQQDLQSADERRRSGGPQWIIVQGHRPFYCNVEVSGACDSEQEQSRTDYYHQGKFAVEPLFYKYGVDLAFFGHVHDYSRFLPVYNRTLRNISQDTPYTNPRATVYLTIGGAGNPEMHQPPPTGKSKCTAWDVGCVAAWSPWAACQTGYYPACPDFNFGKVRVHNKTHLHWQQVSVTNATNHGATPAGGAPHVIDEMWLIADQHGSFEGHEPLENEVYV